MKISNYIIGISFLALICVADCRAENIDTQIVNNPEIVTPNIDVEQMEKNMRKSLTSTASQGDKRDRKRLMRVIENMRKRQMQRDNLDLPPELQEKYKRRNFGYVDSDDFEDYLNSVFMKDLDKIYVASSSNTQIQNPMVSSPAPVVMENMITENHHTETNIEPEVFPINPTKKTSGRKAFYTP